MDWLTNNWWVWLGVIALLPWAFTRYRRTAVSQHAHADHGMHLDDQEKQSSDAPAYRAHASHGGGCGGGHARH
jgi:hypothetical protein